MRKATKILTLILIVVFVLSVFAGCDLVGRNVAKYRDAKAFTVGNETITVGKLLDTFNSYYNNYYYYISSGYIDASQLLEMAISSLVQQYMQIDDYVNNPASVKNNVSGLQATVRNAEYLNADEFAYVVKYVNYLAYQAFDGYTEDNIASKYDLEDAPTEDTSRDFTVYDELTNMKGEPASSFAEYTRDQNFVSKEANEYFEDNYPFLNVTDALNLNGYVYDLSDSEQKAKAEDRVKEYNDRRTEEEEDELTVEEYVEILEDTRKQYQETVQNNYGISLSDFMNNQLGDMVNSCILAKWSYEQYKDIEADKQALEETLKKQFEDARNAQIADFNIKNNFDSFITSLGSSSNIYNLPKEAENYVFVKNILIPFDSYQTTLLSALQSTLGSAERDAYIKARNKEAGKIVAQYFDSDKYDEEIEKLFDKNTWFEDKKKEDDEDSLWKAKTNVFVYDEATDTLAINPNGVLNQFFAADGTVNAIADKTKAETIIELMKRFNTDTAQHTAAFDYVVYVGDDWEDYSHSWVKEFYTAVNEDLIAGGKEYTLCVSSYGVHIIYLTGRVSESDKLFTEFRPDDILNSATPSYNLFKTYFNSQMSIKTNAAFKALQQSKLDNADYIKLSYGFSKFLKDNNFSFDFDQFIEELKEEA